jgi:type IV pilus biogenesis protein CpaD/CtpE
LWAAVDDELALAGTSSAGQGAATLTAWRAQVAAAFHDEKGAPLELEGVRATSAVLRCGQRCEVVLRFNREPLGMLVPSDVRVLGEDGEPVRVTLVEVKQRTATLTLDAERLGGAALYATRGGSGPLLARP